MLYTPHINGGFGFRSVWHLQGLEKWNLFLLHYRRRDTTGKLIRASIRWTQLESGLKGQIFDKDHDKYKTFLTPTWCTHLWEYLWSYKTTVQENEPWTYQLPHANDFFLMEKIYESNMSDEYKQFFNEDRLSMNNVSASDIVSPNSGDTILRPIYDGKNYIMSKWKWPNYTPFHKTWYKVWRIVITQFILPHLCSTPLGKTINESHHTFTHFVDDNNLLLGLDDLCTYRHNIMFLVPYQRM